MKISDKTIPKDRSFFPILLFILGTEKYRVLLTRDPIFQVWSDAIDMIEISWVFDETRSQFLPHISSLLN